jgi:hypothetical protein
VLNDICFLTLVYTNVITNFGNAAALMDMPWSLVAEVEVTAIIALFVQGFYVFRVWRLSHKNIYLTLLVSILIIPAFGKKTPLVTYFCMSKADVSFKLSKRYTRPRWLGQT